MPCRSTISFIVFAVFDAFVSASVSHSWVAQETAVALNRVFHAGGWLFPYSDRYSLVAQWLNHMHPHVEFFQARKHYHDSLEWLDSEYQAAGLALITTLIYAGIRRKIDKATSLILHICAGWWIAFLLFPVLLGIRMLPPKGDNWAGMLGMVIALLVFFHRDRQPGVNLAIIVTGVIGGLGFATACVFKQLEMHFLLPYCSTNWHSILEQSYGLINGLGVATAMCIAMRLAPRRSDEPAVARWTDAWAVFFVLIVLTYVNLVKEVHDWTGTHDMPEKLYFLTAEGWFDLFFALIAATAVILLIRHLRRGLPMLTMSWLGRGQLMYLFLLWWMILGDDCKSIVGYGPERMVTEGTIFVNGLLCTLMALLWCRTRSDAEPTADPPYRTLIPIAAAAGLVVWALSGVLYFGIVRATWGNTPVDRGDMKIRFGPNATIHKAPG